MSNFFKNNEKLTKENINYFIEWYRLRGVELVPYGKNEADRIKMAEEKNGDKLVYDYIIQLIMKSASLEARDKTYEFLDEKRKKSVDDNMFYKLQRRMGNLEAIKNDAGLYQKYEACNTFDELNNLLNEIGNYDPKQFEDFKHKGRFIINADFETVKDKALPEYVNSLTDEQISNIEKEIREFKPIFFKEFTYKNKYADDINKLKDKNINLDTINKVNDLLLAPNYTSNELDSLRQFRESELLKLTRGMTNDGIERQTEFNANAIELKKDLKGATFDFTLISGDTKEEKAKNKAEFEKLKESELVFTNETKNAVKEIFNKLDEFGYYENGVVKEQGIKAYALRKYNDAIVDFTKEIEAINNGEKEANQEKLDKLSNDILMHDKQTKELLDLVHKNLPADTYDFYAGNVDVARNSVFPPSIREDFAGVSQLNGIYSIYSFYKSVVAKSEEKPTIDEFLDKPLHYLKAYYRDTVVASKDLNKLIQGPDGKGYSGADAIKLLLSDTVVLDEPNVTDNSRIAESLVCLDKQNIKRNYIAKGIFDKAIVDPAQQAEFNRRRISKKEYLKLDKFLIVDEPQKDLKLLDFELFNPDTLEFENPGNFDEITYMLEKGQGVDQFAEKLSNSLIDLLKNTRLSTEKIIELGQKAALKYMLITKPLADSKDAVKLKAISELETLIRDGKTYLEYIDHLAETKNINLGIIYPRLNIENNFKATYDNRNTLLNNPTLVGENEFEYDKIMASLDANRIGHFTKASYDDYVIDTLNMSQNELDEFEIEGIISKNADLSTKTAYFYLRDEYCRNKYGEDYDELSSEEKDIIYSRYIDQARLEKETYAARQYMVKTGLTDNSDVQPQDQLEKTLKELEEDKKARELQEKENEKIRFEERIKTELSRMDANGHKDVSKDELVLNITGLVGDAFAKIDTTKTNYQQELQREAIKDNNDKLEFIINYGLGLLPEDARKELYNKLDADSRQRIEDNLRTELANIARNRIEIPKFKTDAYEKITNKETTLEEINLRVDSLLTAEEKNSGKFIPYNRLDANTIEKNRDLILSTITNSLTDRQMQLVDYQIKEFKPTFESNTLNTYARTHEQGIYKLKEIALEDATKANDPFISVEYSKKLELVNNLLIDGTGSYGSKIHDWVGQREKAMEKDLANREEKYVKDNKIPLERTGDRFNITILDEDARYDEIVNDNGEKPSILTVHEKDQKKFQKLKSTEIVLSNQAKSKIKDIFNYMERYNYTNDGIIGEQGSKVYGLKAYVDKLDNLTAILDKAEEGKELDAEEKANALKGVDDLLHEKGNVDQLLSMIHDRFQIDGDNVMYPGNLDVSREAGLPMEWRRDSAGISTLNGLYSTINFIKANNFNIDKFLDNPVSYINQYYEEKVYPLLDPNKTLKGKSGIDGLMNMLTEPYHLVNKELVHGISRIVETLAKIDPNAKNLDQNLTVASVFNKLSGNLGDAERRYFLANMGNQLDRFFYVKEPLENASILTYPTYDAKNCRLVHNKYFDEIKYIQNDKRTLSEFKADLDKNIIEALQKTYDAAAKDDIDLDIFDPDNIVKAALNATRKYLLVRGDKELDDPAYDELKSFTDNSKDYLEKLVNKAIENKEFDFTFKGGEKCTFEDIDKRISAETYNTAKDFEKEFKEFTTKNEKKLGKFNEPALSRADYLESRAKKEIAAGRTKAYAEAVVYAMTNETKDRWYNEYLANHEKESQERNRNIFQKFLEEKGISTPKPEIDEDVEELNAEELEAVLDEEDGLFEAKEEKVEVKEQSKEVNNVEKEEVKQEHYEEPKPEAEEVKVLEDNAKQVQKITIDFSDASEIKIEQPIEEAKEEIKKDDIKKDNNLSK